MILFESIRVALAALWANKMRALLTMLGVIIGVMSVIVMIAIVQGIRQQILDQFAGNGANLMFASYRPKIGTVSRGGFGGLTMDDARAVQARASLVESVSPDAQTSVVAQAGAGRRSVTLMGVLDTFNQTQVLPLDGGRFLSADDVASWSKACVLGHKVRQDLFGDADPLGREIHCTTDGGADVSLTVVGILKEKDANPGGGDFNNNVYTALSTVQKRFTGDTKINGFTARSREVSQVEAAADQVWGVLKLRHPLNYKDFVVDTQEGILKQLDTLLGGIQLVLGGVGGLALLTGGIGIMNIMLVSVTERTREIGIRKAVGATRSAILLQFVVEAMVVSGLGGLIGVSCGYGLARLVDAFAHKTLPTFVPFWATELGFGFAVGVGLFFGIYPAFRAAKLDPITALRYE
jgi:putative ABC transport system permease protein